MNLIDNFLELVPYSIEIIIINKPMILFNLKDMVINQISKIRMISIFAETLEILIIKIKIFQINILLSKCNKTFRKQTSQILCMVKEKFMMFDNLRKFQIFPKFIYD